MAHSPTTGRTVPLSTLDFNERVKRLVADKPDPKKPEPRKSFSANRKPPHKG